MTQVLVLGFNSFVYKKFPRARIFLNEHFVDEIDVPEFISKFFLMRFAKKEEHVYTRIERNINNNKKTINEFDSCPPLFFYEINEEILQPNLNLKIEIKNQDNNYSNGFMTLTTYVELLHLYMLPKDLITRYLRIRQAKPEMNEKIYSRKTVPVFENLANYTMFTSQKNIINHATLFTTADSGTYDIELHKKNHRYVPDINSQYGMIKDKVLIGPQARELRDRWKHFIFDKYLHYENL